MGIVGSPTTPATKAADRKPFFDVATAAVCTAESATSLRERETLGSDWVVVGWMLRRGTSRGAEVFGPVLDWRVTRRLVGDILVVVETALREAVGIGLDPVDSLVVVG
jgi:hypothetical protein